MSHVPEIELCSHGLLAATTRRPTLSEPNEQFFLFLYSLPTNLILWTGSACSLEPYRFFFLRQRFSRHRILVRLTMDAAALAVSSSFSPSTHLALTSCRRDGTILRVLQTLFRLMHSPLQSPGHSTLASLIPTRKRHSRRLPHRRLPFPNPLLPLGERPLALVSLHTSLR
jgi:hypothetical protein